MEYYYRCHKCGRRTPSFEYEDYLNDYALDWKVTDDEILCLDCIAEITNNKFNTLEVILWTTIVILLLILIFR